MRGLLDAVLKHAQQRPERDCVRLFPDRLAVGRLTYGEIAAAAGRAASFYQSRGLARGDVVALIGGHDLDFYGAWLGAVWIGAIPAVLAEPSVRIDKEIYWSRIATMLKYAEVKLLAVSSSLEVASWPAGVAHARYDEIVRGAGPVPDRCTPGDDDGLLLQHSSGTTGVPKGVLLTHGMVVRHIEAYVDRTGLGESDVVASWLPLYHDLGMVANFIVPLHAGATVVWLSPFEWVLRPELLLEAISEHRATVAQMPNFAFSFLATTVDAPTTYDLSTLRALWSGGEPLHAESMLLFAERFAPAGFRKESLGAGYGMAESVCAIASSGPGVPLRFNRIRKHDWRARHVAAPASDQDEPAGTLMHVSNGTMFRGCEIRVVNADGVPLSPGHAGRVLVRTPYLFNGYFRRGAPAPGLINDEGFYDTGDLGYVDEDGHVYVTGRLKDLIIVAGRNVYAQDVETIANGVTGVHPGRAVCFGVSIPSRGTEGAVLLFESEEPEERWGEVIDRVREEVARQADLDLFDVRAAPRGTLRKSTAGKLARQDNRASYLERRFGPLPRAIADADGGST